ncbi:hypothetical protein Tco_0497957 [Tanacetum coccineum]
MMEADFELAQRLQTEEQGEITIEERSRLFVELMNKRKKHFAMLRAEEKRRKPPTKAQKRNLMSTYLKNMGGYKHNQLKSKSYEEIHNFINKARQEQEKSDLQKALELQKQLDEREEVIAEADPAQDVMDLHRLVKERYVTTSPEGYDLMLWGDLKTLFEPDEEDEVWRNQHGYNLISWRLIDSCGIHILLMDNGIAIHMMVEKKYPLIQEMLSKMLNRKLEIDHESEMAFELLRFTRSQLQKPITANGDTVNTASIDVSVAGPSNEHQDKKTLVVIRDVEEELRRATPVPTVQSQDKGKGKMVEPEPTPKNSIKAQIQRDVEIAQRLHEEEKVELERMQRERDAQEEASNVTLIVEFDNVQAIMEADALLAARLQEKEREQFSIDEQARFLVETITERKRFTYNQLKNKSFEEIQKLYEKEQKWIKYFIPMDSKKGRKKAVRRDQEQNLMKRVLKDKRLEKLQFQVKNNQQKRKKNYQKKNYRNY